MRRIAEFAAVALAFAAGWCLRGCAAEPTPPSPATPPAPRPVAAPSAPVHRERNTSRGTAETTTQGAGARVARTSEEPTRPAAQPESPKPETPKPAESAPDATKPIEKVTGIVVDTKSGAGVEGVTIHLCVSREDGEFGGWTGETSDAEGNFVCDLPPSWANTKNKFEIRAGRDGYRPARVAVTTDTARVEIEKLDRIPLAGRIVGTARGEDGRPITGRIFIGMNDELDLHSFGVWANADANGRFAIDAVAPGHWTVGLSESRESFEVNVVEGGEASVELRGKFEEATGAFAAGELTEAAYAREKTRLEHLMYGAMGSKDEAAAGSAGYAVQQLEYQWLRYAPGRDVVVTGLPAAGGAYVRLDRREGACCEWRAPIADGKAAFPSIPLGRWRAILVRPGEADVGVEVDVVKGDGVLTVDLAAAK